MVLYFFFIYSFGFFASCVMDEEKKTGRVGRTDTHTRARYHRYYTSILLLLLPPHPLVQLYNKNSRAGKARTHLATLEHLWNLEPTRKQP